MAKSIKFRSKISKGLMIFILILLILPIAVLYLLEKSIAEAGLLLILALPVIFFVIHLFFNTQYIITAKGKLKIRSGLYTFRPIDIQSIYRISSSKSLSTAPATSLDRLEIRYGRHRKILVSPQDKSGFIAALKKVNKRIEVVSDSQISTR